MDKINALLADLENRIKENILEIENLSTINEKLRAENKNLSIEKNDVEKSFSLLDDKFKALKIASTISGSENDINETKGEINLLIAERGGASTERGRAGAGAGGAAAAAWGARVRDDGVGRTAAVLLCGRRLDMGRQLTVGL